MVRSKRSMIPFNGFYVAVWDNLSCGVRQFFFATEAGAKKFIKGNPMVITHPLPVHAVPRDAILADTGRLIE